VHDGQIDLILNKEKDDYDFSQYLRLNFDFYPSDKIRIYFALGNKLEHFNSLENIKAVVWAINLSYYYKFNVYAGIGDRLIDYSPYTIHMEDWNDNVFKGLFLHFESKRYEIEMDGFIGLHAEETNSIRFEGVSLKADAGFINKYFINRIQTETPTIWGAFRLARSWSDHVSSELIYVRENYILEKSVTGFITYYVFDNNLAEIPFHIRFHERILLDLSGAAMIKNYTKYNGAGNYYGQGKHKLEKDYENSLLAYASEVKLRLNGLVPVILLNGNYTFTGRYIEQEYNPVHMDDGRLEESRGEDFLDDLYPGEKGFIVAGEWPFIPGNFIGFEYQRFLHTVHQKLYQEKRYFIKQFFTKDISLMFLLYNKIGYLDTTGNIDDLTGFIVRSEAMISSYLSFNLWFVEHRDNIKGNNTLFFETLFKF